MNKPFKPSNSPIWDELAAHRLSLEDIRISKEFNKDPNRFEKMHLSAAGLTLDYSKNLVTDETISLLIQAAESLELKDRIASLIKGDKVNTTEDRPALHTALRDFSGNAPFSKEVEAAFAKMADIVERIHNGQWIGATGHPITDVVNIGIGGSHLGPMMVTDALQGFSSGKVCCHFVSNIDSTDIHSVLETVNPESTLFIISSKSFTTLETLQNATTARNWLEANLPEAKNATGKHFLAVSAKPEKAGEFGIPDSNVLPMWDWVGGRYSLWSAIGIAIALSMGMENFHRLRKGAGDMDRHFESASPGQNIPVLLAIIGIWNNNYWSTANQAVLPYHHRLRYFPEFLQQLEMESNGKSVSLQNEILDYHTAPLIWGTVETNGQHSFHQLLHQGNQVVPVDFILPMVPELDNDEHHLYLVSNCLAQANALMTGRQIASSDGLSSHRYMPGNRPSNMIIMERLTPENLGALISLYEHKVFVQSIIWNINAFDQFGVELGKEISSLLTERLSGGSDGPRFDPSTEGLIDMYKKGQNEK